MAFAGQGVGASGGGGGEVGEQSVGCGGGEDNTRHGGDSGGAKDEGVDNGGDGGGRDGRESNLLQTFTSSSASVDRERHLNP